jgi:hypothetical protein
MPSERPEGLLQRQPLISFLEYSRNGQVMPYQVRGRRTSERKRLADQLRRNAELQAARVVERDMLIGSLSQTLNARLQ